MRGWRLAVPLASVYLAFLARETNWLRSAPAALWIFWLGMQTYFLARERENSSAVLRRIASFLRCWWRLSAAVYCRFPNGRQCFSFPC